MFKNILIYQNIINRHKSVFILATVHIADSYNRIYFIANKLAYDFCIKLCIFIKPYPAFRSFAAIDIALKWRLQRWLRFADFDSLFATHNKFAPFRLYADKHRFIIHFFHRPFLRRSTGNNLNRKDHQ